LDDERIGCRIHTMEDYISFYEEAFGCDGERVDNVVTFCMYPIGRDGVTLFFST